MDRFFSLWQISEGCPRREIIFFCSCALRLSARLSLGPVLFLSYINDLPEYVSNSTVRLFADDTILYLTIHNSSDCDKLQEDLNNLERWESDWQMSFHPEKCEVIHITTKKTHILHSYSLHGHIILFSQSLKSNTLEYTSVKTLSGIHN